MAYIEEDLTYSIIGAGYDVYRELYFGFREHVYVMTLERLLLAKGHRVGREVSISVFFQRIELTTDRLDMLVDDKVVVEVKATHQLQRGLASAAELPPMHQSRSRVAAALRTQRIRAVQARGLE